MLLLTDTKHRAASLQQQRSLLVQSTCLFLLLLDNRQTPYVAGISRRWAGAQTADHGRRFLKMSKNELSAMSLFSGHEGRMNSCVVMRK